MSEKRNERLAAFGRLLDIMDELREKCPWDRKQSMESLRHLSIEELYELSDAILEKDMQEIKKELGDLALHIVFYSKIASETGDFDIADVLNGVCDKLIRRHPHIYGDVKAEDETTVKRNWEQIKLKEGEGKRSVLSGVPASLPAMVKAYRIQEKARGVNFDWQNEKQVWEKVKEEMREFHAEYAEAKESDKKADKIESEFGDMLFALINFARFAEVNPEDALERTNKKFIKRFAQMETYAAEENRSLDSLSFEEWDAYWERAKKVFR